MMSTSSEVNGSVRNHGGGTGRYPFTPTQWQELEHQALFYKYMISGMPIPPDLLYTIKTSLDSSTNLILNHHMTPNPSIGWNCFQMGFGRKIDPEPGRCRRTDGKKWRCSKEAYPDSKYCERHMHRGRNRSRKPVEVNMGSTPSSNKSPNYPSPKLLSSSSSSSDHHYSTTTHLSSYSKPSSDHHLLLDSSPYTKTYGIKKEDHLFSSGTINNTSMSGSWPLLSKQTTLSEYHQGDQAYYDQKDEPQKVMHRFFDEWPDSSTTQLSISIPTSAHDFFLTHNDK